MKKSTFLVPIFCSIFSVTSYAQHQTHIIKQGDNISSLARQYHVTVSDIFKLNNLNDKTTLRIGQKIVIPSGKNVTNKAVVATPTPVPATPAKAAPSANQYQIVAGDNLLKIAKKFKVTEQQLKDWNNLKNDAIRAGDYLYISNTGNAIVKPTIPTKKEETVATEIKTVKTEPTKKTETQQQPAPVVQPIVKPTLEEKPIVKETKQEPKPTEQAIPNANDSYFQKEYASTKNSVEGLSGTFKTIAGWHDSKYYVLLNNVQSGSIVKVSANNKSVYAKVLGMLPNIKEDNNLTMRVSNATAAALGISENRFSAKVDF